MDTSSERFKQGVDGDAANDDGGCIRVNCCGFITNDCDNADVVGDGFNDGEAIEGWIDENS